jgi:hypothetical protein
LKTYHLRLGDEHALSGDSLQSNRFAVIIRSSSKEFLTEEQCGLDRNISYLDLTVSLPAMRQQDTLSVPRERYFDRQTRITWRLEPKQ